MLTEKLEKYLSDHHTKFRTIHHTPAFTAQETAELSHISGKQLAKSVILKADGKFILLLEPANHKVNLKELSKWLGAKEMELATEQEFKSLFPDCEVGAMPPFGHLFHMDVYIEDTLAEQENITFNAGTHEDLIEMRYKDFEKLEKPKKVHWH